MTPQSFTFPYGLLLNFSCDEGFRLQGPAQSQCQADGTWDPPLPTCQPGESASSPPSRVPCPPASQVSASPALHSPGAALLAHRGGLQGVFSSVPSHYLIFFVFFFFSPPVQCPSIQRQEGVVVHINKLWYEVNETVTFHCRRNGYSGGSSKTTCSADGTWTPPPTCVVSTTKAPFFLLLAPFSCFLLCFSC